MNFDQMMLQEDSKNVKKIKINSARNHVILGWHIYVVWPIVAIEGYDYLGHDQVRDHCHTTKIKMHLIKENIKSWKDACIAISSSTKWN